MRKNEKEAAELIRYLNDTRAERFPIQNSALDKAGELERNSYFKLLFMLYLYCSNTSEDQISFLKRRIAGSYGETADTYLRQAMEITGEQFEEILGQLTDQMVCALAVDGALLLNLGEPQEDEYRLLAELLESMKMEKDKLKELMGLVLAIETQNYAQYLTFYSDDYPEYKAYFLSDAPSYYCDENYLTVAGLSDLENCLKQLDPQKCGTKEVRFFRCSCDMEGLTISLTGRHRIRFDQCTFAGCHKPLSYSVWEEDWTNNKKIVLENCKLVLVDDCEFINFDAPIFGLKGCERATFSNSNFRNCIRQSKLSCFWDYAPCIFEGSEKIQMTIDACSFVQCGGKDKENIYASGVIANCPAYIRSSSFEDCYHVHSVSSGMYCEDPGRDQYLFTGGFDIDNNRKNSSRLVPKD